MRSVGNGSDNRRSPASVSGRMIAPYSLVSVAYKKLRGDCLSVADDVYRTHELTTKLGVALTRSSWFVRSEAFGKGKASTSECLPSGSRHTFICSPFLHFQIVVDYLINKIQKRNVGGFPRAACALATPRMSDQRELTPLRRVLAASCGSLLSSLVVTPFDVIKTRMQAQTVPHGTFAESLQRCSHFQVQTGVMGDAWCPRCPAPVLRFNGSFDAIIKLTQHEGITSLWRGLSPTLLLSVPSTVLYLSLYDSFKADIGQHPMSPIIAGVAARSITTSLVSPVELIRTRAQAASGRSGTSLPGAMSILREELKFGGFTSLWRGVSPTLWRDVPFSAVYWMLYEHMRDSYSNTPISMPVLSFFGGAVSGMVAAAVTHPFDVVSFILTPMPFQS